MHWFDLAVNNVHHDIVKRLTTYALDTLSSLFLDTGLDGRFQGQQELLISINPGQLS